VCVLAAVLLYVSDHDISDKLQRTLGDRISPKLLQ